MMNPVIDWSPMQPHVLTDRWWTNELSFSYSALQKYSTPVKVIRFMWITLGKSWESFSPLLPGRFTPSWMLFVDCTF